MNPPLLSIRKLRLRYGDKTVVDDVSLEIHAGQILGLIGESGSGKSLTALAALGLLSGDPSIAGSIHFRGTELTGLDETGWRAIRGRQIGIVFQDPMNSLNPLMTLGAQILEAIPPERNHGRKERTAQAVRLLGEVGLPDPERQLGRYPFELSGGQQQRAMIAMVLAAEPALLIADEPTTALDVTTQAQVLALLREIQQRRGMAMLFISHDLDAVLAMADRVAVMRHGQLLEQGEAQHILHRPRHAYTQALVAAHARRSPSRAARTAIAGEPAIVLDAVCVDYGNQRRNRRRALSGVTLQLQHGATLGIAGESGSGKSTLARAIMGLVAPAAGTVSVCGMNPADRRVRAAFAQSCQYVFQDTSGSLNPRLTILQTLLEPLRIHGLHARHAMAGRCAAMLEEVGLDAALLQRYPHQLSGGQRQRVVIARALSMSPRLLVCDEPVSALDATVRNQVIDLIVRLRDERNLTLVFIGHDLSLMEDLADEVLVMKNGAVVEHGPAAQVFNHPQSPYTRELLQASRLAPRQSQAAAVAVDCAAPHMVRAIAGVSAGLAVGMA